MLGCVVSISSSSCETFFSPWHRALMMRSRIGVASTPKSSAALAKMRSDSSSGRVMAASGPGIEAAR